MIIEIIYEYPHMKSSTVDSEPSFTFFQRAAANKTASLIDDLGEKN
jgi:hypothetical protein